MIDLQSDRRPTPRFPGFLSVLRAFVVLGTYRCSDRGYKFELIVDCAADTNVLDRPRRGDFALPGAHGRKQKGLNLGV
jgi:hypothetical protein